MLIVLEGPDGAGKTTLAKEIVRQTNGIYLHGTVTDDQFQHHLGLLSDAVFHLNAGRDVVMDRHWISEYCYAPELRGGISKDYGLVGRAFHRHLIYLGALYVMCVPPSWWVAANHASLREKRVELVDKTSTMLAIASRYEDMVTGSIVRFNDANVNYVSWVASQLGAAGPSPNRTDLGVAAIYQVQLNPIETISANAEQIIALANKRFEMVPEIYRLPAYRWGPVTGNVGALGSLALLVGDRSNNDTVQPPFLSNRASSKFLNDSLHAGNVMEHDIALINANDASDGILLATLSAAGRVIYLGEAAERRCEDLLSAWKTLIESTRPEGIPQVRLPHPQYRSRFFRRAVNYTNLLEQAIYVK